MAPDLLQVEVVYAGLRCQARYALRVEQGTTVAEAIRRSGVLEVFSEIDFARQRVGVHGKLVRPAQVLRDGDRVEIYRPLSADPKEARRKRAGRRGEP
jgi:putative ubiquitin-RnfH superfamily antitoxin RatB of RatAB toxin-antitoxin module